MFHPSHVILSAELIWTICNMHFFIIPQNGWYAGVHFNMKLRLSWSEYLMLLFPNIFNVNSFFLMGVTSNTAEPVYGG